jgi:hypothetical protein
MAGVEHDSLKRAATASSLLLLAPAFDQAY